MNEFDLLTSNQIVLARNALVGDSAAQRAVLEMAVALADAGIQPIDVFKEAALESLRIALKNDKLQSRENANKKGSKGKEFTMAIEYWKAKLTGHPKPSSSVENMLDPSGKKNLKPAIDRAVNRHGLLAKERALFHLSWGQDGPDFMWLAIWEAYRLELQKPMEKAIDKVKLSAKTADILKTKF